MYFISFLQAVLLFVQVMFTVCGSQTIDSTSVSLNWWDYNLEQWKAVRCLSGGGSCIQFKGVTFRLFGAYIKRGTRLTVHINNHGRKNLQMYVRSGKPPTSKLNDYEIRKKEPGFTQWTCKGVFVYWMVKSDPSEPSESVEFGVSVTSDWCSSKDYSGQCPYAWIARSGGWCDPPKSYTGPCAKQNFFGTLEKESEYSNPQSQEYKVLWSESCGADWPCSNFIGNKCEPVLNVMKNKRWEQTKCVDSTTICHSFSLERRATENRLLLFVDVLPGSHLAVEVFSSKNSRIKSRVSNELNLTLSVGLQNKDHEIENTQMIFWKTSVRGIAPYIELQNHNSFERIRYFIGILSENSVKIEGGVRVYNIHS